ncbi:Pentulose kinase [Auriculariales sp. MPI-PUGE-AT-0066]|nr:Pentulose kinase [Auriculariales sp. MPI-PUGE-AT-0066]
MSYYIGIDVGTGSVRSLICDDKGTVAAAASKPITTWRDNSDHRIFEQSTADIWAAICTVVQRAIADASIDPASVRGIGFDATCSLAVTDRNGSPATVTRGPDCGAGDGLRNVILWADHRAEFEASLINSTPAAAPVLDFVGGTVSLEMEIPKILWLKKNVPERRFEELQFFDLPDYLTYRATGSTARSTCSLTCKCSYMPNVGWKHEFFSAIGLQSLVDAKFRQVGAGDNDPVLTAGLPVGTGLTEAAAAELGLVPGTPVASSVIDAYAGWMGTVAARFREGVPATTAGPTGAPLDTTAESDGGVNLSAAPTIEISAERLAVVAGTSSCHLINSPRDIFVPGVWGPYRNAVLPGFWMNEGGQSSTGQLIDFVLTTHPAYTELKTRATAEARDMFEILFETLDALCAENGLQTGQYTHLVRHVHMYPDLHGNRSPLADPQMRGALMGLSLDSGIGDLAKKFYIALESIALQTRHIVEAMRTKGHTIRSICISGGQARNKHLCQLIAALCDVEVIVPSTWTSVVLGAAMLGKIAHEVSGVPVEANQASRWTSQTQVDEIGAKYAERLWEIMVEMTPSGGVIRATATDTERKILDAKYRIFLETIDIQRRWRREVDAAAGTESPVAH